MKTIQRRIEESRQYLGDGTYEALQPVITSVGFDLGWRYLYPHGICLNQINYIKLGKTLDELEEEGIVELKIMKCTCI